MSQDCQSCFAAFQAPISAGPRFAGKLFCTRNAPAASNSNPDAWIWPLVQSDWTCREGADASTGQSYASNVNSVPGTGGNGPGYLATSTTSATIAASGSISITTQLLLAYTPGARVRITSTGSGAFAEGVVTAYDAAGLLTFTADLASGSGSHTDWNINLAGQPGTGVSSKGTFTLTVGLNSQAIADVAVTATSRITITPTSQAAADLQAVSAAEAAASASGEASAAYISTKTVGVSFTVQAGNGGTFTGAETFDYTITN